jgi:hypothetical protein
MSRAGHWLFPELRRSLVSRGARREERGLVAQMSDEQRCAARNQARPFGLHQKCGHALLPVLPRGRHCLRLAPSLAAFLAATQRGNSQ